VSKVPADLLHGGVFKSAGVVHTGAFKDRARQYVRDAKGYRVGAETTANHTIKLLLEDAKQSTECANRSDVLAVIFLLEWLNEK
jgi:hypothetical protein